ncbi:hypothetical protein CHLRE_02g142586v5 [Chlamydomonas reinhardtii]|uniref:CxC3 like cysteine cluster domain-containing protein n=1 Tax=Chlamydomonas reinhardtii TaxID=3055 RepID=A0A2K3E4F0_CHLRE|nr:uncharacterized protein CHLRE_02g142586v5 [Chlamydomonas reinhardtii]PNW87669.1 hypothetical protein CHLRE_02g142586v5 [Chlamydomonas reinhardtii]
MRITFMQQAAALNEQRLLRRKLLLEQAQQRFDALAASWQAAHACTTSATSCTTYNNVRYIGLQCSGVVSVPTVTCSCGAAFTPDAIAAGCFPSTPTEYDTLYDLEVHNAYAWLGLRAGLSASDFTEFLAEFSGTGLDDRQYLGSFFGHLRASHNHDSFGALGVEGLDQGPFSGCPVCSATANTAHPYRLGVAADAVTKLGHFASCGIASSGIPPQLSGHFGAVDAEVQQLFEAGQLNLQAVVKDLPSNAAADARSEAPGSS